MTEIIHLALIIFIAICIIGFTGWLYFSQAPKDSYRGINNEVVMKAYRKKFGIKDYKQPTLDKPIKPPTQTNNL